MNRRNLIHAVALIVAATILFSAAVARAQPPSEQFIGGEDDPLRVYLALDRRSVTTADEDHPIPVHLDKLMLLHMQINTTSVHPLNITGMITFLYQGFEVLPITIVNPENNRPWVVIPPSVQIEPIDVYINWSQALSMGPVDLMTGLFEATVNFTYQDMEDPGISGVIGTRFYMLIEASLMETITSVAGIATVAVTGGAVYGLGSSIWQLIDGFKTAYKLRGIQKKASEIKSLPNLTVIGALPPLFTLLASLTQMRTTEKAEGHSSAVSEYMVRQRLREVAPSAWPRNRCPKCKKSWPKDEDTCKKCGIDEAEARREYAELLASKVPSVIKLLGKKKSMSIDMIAKKTKSSQYNAGVIASALVDTGLTEIQKVRTPFRSFVTNLLGVVFVVLTWQQLLGDKASHWQTTLTLMGAALSVGVIVALYVARKTQIEKLHIDTEGRPSGLTPATADTGEESLVYESEDEGTGETETEAAGPGGGEGAAPPDSAPAGGDEEGGHAGGSDADSGSGGSPPEDADARLPSLTPEELDRERE